MSKSGEGVSTRTEGARQALPDLFRYICEKCTCSVVLTPIVRPAVDPVVVTGLIALIHT